MFNGLAFHLYGEKRWTWDVPDDGGWHTDPKFENVRIKKILEDFEEGVRVAIFLATEDHVYDWHIHPDACEIITVAKGNVNVKVNGKTHIINGGGYGKIAAEQPHYAEVEKGTLFTLLYRRFGTCDFCLHKLGIGFQGSDGTCQ